MIDLRNETMNYNTAINHTTCTPNSIELELNRGTGRVGENLKERNNHYW